jgi:Holliday junction resolvase RusA-like endonuclease
MAQLVFETTIPIRPQGKARPKVVRRGQHTVAITPDQTVLAEQCIRQHVTGTWKEAPLDAPLAVCITAYFLRPASKSKKVLFPTGKPDRDNIAKLVQDSLNGILWRDDSIIVDGRDQKRYCNAAFPQECIHLVVRTLTEEDL